MMLLPKNKNDYPYFIGAYWLFMWAIATFVILLILTQNSIDGFMVGRDCIKELNEVCTLYSAPYKIPFTQEFIIQTIGAGILIGGMTIIVGFCHMLIKTK